LDARDKPCRDQEWIRRRSGEPKPPHKSEVSTVNSCHRFFNGKITNSDPNPKRQKGDTIASGDTEPSDSKTSESPGPPKREPKPPSGTHSTLAALSGVLAGAALVAALVFAYMPDSPTTQAVYARDPALTPTEE